MKKYLTFTFAIILAFVLVACGGGSNVTSVEVSASATSIKVGETTKLTALVKPEGADQGVSWQSSKTTVATVDADGTVKGVKKGKAVITATSTADPNMSGKITITVTDTSGSKPDLAGYEIVVAYAAGVEYELDPRMEYLGSTGGSPTRSYAAQAWNDVEEMYNCTITVKGYPTTDYNARWGYILEQAKNNVTDFDIYWIPTAQIATLYTALIDMSDLYALYGNSTMSTADIMAKKYKGALYGWSWTNNATTSDDPLIAYNVKLLEQIDVESPANLFMQDKWTFADFKTWCLDAQTKLNALSMDEEDKYYVISGALAYYVRQFANTSNVALCDTLSMEVNITNQVVVDAANLMIELYKAGCVDPANQVDGSVATWNNGHSLLNIGSSYFVNYENRWKSDLWGDDTAYGFCPSPYAAGMNHTTAKWATYTQTAFVIPKAIEEKIQRLANGNENVTVENIYQAWFDCYALTEQYIKADPDYDEQASKKIAAQTKWGDDASVTAWLFIENNLDTIALFDPMKEITNCWSGDWGHFTAGVISPNLGYTEATDYVAAVTPALADLKQAFIEKYN